MLVFQGDQAGDPAIKYTPSPITGQSQLFAVNRVAGLTLMGTGAAGDGIDIIGTTHVTVERNVIESFAGSGIRIDTSDGLGRVGFVGLLRSVANIITVKRA